MKRIISFSVLAFFLFLASPGLYAQDKVVAIVNNEIITQKDLNDFLNYIRLQYSREVRGKALAEKLEAMRQDLLQRLTLGPFEHRPKPCRIVLTDNTPQTY